MNHLRIADLLHADTMNFLLEATGLYNLGQEEKGGPILLRADPPDWIAIVPQPAIDGYVAVPVLRRLRQLESGEWRHFPMARPDASPVHEYEEAGTPIEVVELANLPTWSCGAAFHVIPALKKQLEDLICCLEMCAHFPQLALLRAETCRLRECYGNDSHRSYKLHLGLRVVEQEISRAVAWKRFDNTSEESSQVPTAAALAACVFAVYQAIREAEIPIGSAVVTTDFLRDAKICFDLKQSSFIQAPGQAGGPLENVENWSKKERVKLFPKALNEKLRERLGLEWSSGELGS